MAFDKNFWPVYYLDVLSQLGILKVILGQIDRQIPVFKDKPKWMKIDSWTDKEDFQQESIRWEQGIPR